MKKIATIAFTMVIGISMTLMPAFAAEDTYVEDAESAIQAAEAAIQDAETTLQDMEEQEAAEEAAEAAEAEEAEAADPDTEAVSEDVEVVEVDAEATDPEEAIEEETEDDGDISTAEGSAFEGLAGMYVSDIENDPDLCYILEDPTFYRYYEIDENGLISEKKVDLDEVEQFLADADANAEGIDDVENIEMDGDITAMGGGVTGLGKGQTPAKYAGYNRYHCIDISWWQGSISDANWKKIRAAGVTHAIIRCGYSTLSGGKHNKDSTFAGNLNGAYKAGIKVGVYYYSTAVSAAEAKSEAQYVASVIKSYKSKITLPVAFDYETGGRLTSKVMKSVGTASCIAFCDTIKAAGYTPMVYANYNTLSNYINYKTLQSKYKIWLANYTTNGVATTYAGSYYMWQYSSSGRINGLKGNVDINYIFTPKTSTTTTTTKKATTTTTTAKTTVKAAAAPAFKAYSAKTTDEVNYRTGPGTNYRVKGTYKKGTKITIVGISGKWAKLSNGYYVWRGYTAKVTSSVSKYPYSAKTTTAVNYRTGPGTKYKRKGTFKKGAKIKVVGVSGSWAKLSTGYYVSLKYVKKITTTAKTTVKYPYSAKTTTSVNYRTGPGTKYKVKGTYKKGVKIKIKSVKNGWGLMSNGYYIYMKYVKKI